MRLTAADVRVLIGLPRVADTFCPIRDSDRIFRPSPQQLTLAAFSLVTPSRPTCHSGDADRRQRAPNLGLRP